MSLTNKAQIVRKSFPSMEPPKADWDKLGLHHSASLSPRSFPPTLPVNAIVPCSVIIRYCPSKSPELRHPRYLFPCYIPPTLPRSNDLLAVLDSKTESSTLVDE